MARRPESSRGSGKGLGARLRETREGSGLTLREVERRTGLNTGYLSQLERGEVSQPTPAVLQKVANGYGIPFHVLMRWVGYIEEGEGLSPNQARALSYLGDDPSNEEVEAIRAVLNVLRKDRASFTAPGSLDHDLDPDDLLDIRGYAIAVLRKADALGTLPTPLNQVLDVSKLVAAGEVTLTPDERRGLRARFGDLVDKVWSRLQGAIHFKARQVWVNPELPPQRQRFVEAHEIGHHIIPSHRDLYAYLDDRERLRPDVAMLYERQANQAAIELLAQGDALRHEADDSRLSMRLITQLSQRYGISIQAAARRLAETSRQDCALAMSFKGSVTGKLMPPHLYCSPSFEKRFRWKAHMRPDGPIMTGLIATACGGQPEPLVVADARGKATALTADGLDTPRATMVLFVSEPARRFIGARSR